MNRIGIEYTKQRKSLHSLHCHIVLHFVIMKRMTVLHTFRISFLSLKNGKFSSYLADIQICFVNCDQRFRHSHKYKKNRFHTFYLVDFASECPNSIHKVINVVCVLLCIESPAHACSPTVRPFYTRLWKIHL